MGRWRAAPEGQRRGGSAAPSPGCAGYFPINGEDTHRDSPLDPLGRYRAARGTGRGGRGRGRRPDPGRCDGRPLRAEPDLRAAGGGGGPKFIPHSPEQIRRIRGMSSEIEIEVDGGIDARSAPLVVAAGATVLVAGSSVYGFKGGVAAGIKAIRKALD